MTLHDNSRQMTLRIASVELVALRRLARRFDRTPSSEVRRAVHYYLTHFEAVDRALRKERKTGDES
jgi:hypothetical protein